MNSLIVLALVALVSASANADSFKGQQYLQQSSSDGFKGQLSSGQQQLYTMPAQQHYYQSAPLQSSYYYQAPALPMIAPMVYRPFSQMLYQSAPALQYVRGSPIKSIQQSVSYEPIKGVQQLAQTTDSFKGQNIQQTYQAPVLAQESLRMPVKGQYVESSWNRPVYSSYIRSEPIKGMQQQATFQEPIKGVQAQQTTQETFSAPIKGQYVESVKSRPVVYQQSSALKTVQSAPLQRYESVKSMPLQQTDSFKGQQAHYQEPLKAVAQESGIQKAL